MAIALNTNTTAMAAQRSLSTQNTRLADSAIRLSSGKRLNCAADDSSSMFIADSLRSQCLSLGQAIKNASDGIGIIQTADGALSESLNILNTIKTKSIQAAQDGHSLESRKAIQTDINLLLEEFDMIAETTSFNGRKILSGNYSNKAIQAGAYFGETVSISVATVEAQKVGHVTTGELTIGDNREGLAAISIYSNIRNESFIIETVELAYDNDPTHGIGALAININKLSDELGITAYSNVSSTTIANIKQGQTDSNFSINGTLIGAVNVNTNDSSGELTKAINSKTSSHGVFASIDSTGLLTLQSKDGRAISLDYSSSIGSGVGTDAIFNGTDLSTMGSITFHQVGTAEVRINDIGGGEAIALTNGLDFDGKTETTIDSSASKGSILTQDTMLKAGWTTDQEFRGTQFSKPIDLEKATLLRAGNRLGVGSIIISEDPLGGNATIDRTNLTSSTSMVKIGSTLAAGSILGKGTVIYSPNVISEGTTFKGDGKIYRAGPTTSPSHITAGSYINSGTVLASGTVLTNSVRITGVTPTNGNSTVTGGSTLEAGSIITQGTTITGTAQISQVSPTTNTSTIEVGSSLRPGSEFAPGTVIQGNAQIDTVGPTIGNSLIADGSTLADGSILAINTVLAPGQIITTTLGPRGGPGGFVLDQNYTLAGAQTISPDTTLLGGSTIESGSILFPTSQLAGDTAVLTASLSPGAAMTLPTGSVIANFSSLAAGSVLNGDQMTLLGPMALGGDMVLAAGSGIASASTLNTGSHVDSDTITILDGITLNADMDAGNGTIIEEESIILYNSFLGSDARLMSGLTLREDMTLATDMKLTTDMDIEENSLFANGSRFYKDSEIPVPMTLISNMNLDSSMKLLKNSVISETRGTKLLADTTVNGDTYLKESITVKDTITLYAGSEIGDMSSLENGSTLGGTVRLLNSETVAPDSVMKLKSGSVLEPGSIIAEGTYITGSVTSIDGKIYDAGTLLTQTIETATRMTLKGDMALMPESTIAARSRLTANNTVNSVETNSETTSTSRFSDINVPTMVDAQIAMIMTNTAIKDIDSVRSGLGSSQNQLTSIISNLRTTMTQVTASESVLRDVDFASESEVLSKLNILIEAGTFSLAQANVTAQNALSLLEGMGGQAG